MEDITRYPITLHGLATYVQKLREDVQKLRDEIEQLKRERNVMDRAVKK